MTASVLHPYACVVGNEYLHMKRSLGPGQPVGLGHVQIGQLHPPPQIQKGVEFADCGVEQNVTYMVL